MSTTLEELVVELRAENKELLTVLKTSQTQTSAAMKHMADSIGAMVEDSNKSLSLFETAMATAAGFMSGQVVLGAISKVTDAVAGLFKSMVVDGVKGAIETEDAMNRLNQSLASTGKYSKETSAEMERFASGLQATTRFGDDAILNSAALIETLGRLDKDGLQAATKAALNLSAALGMDLDSASRLVGKAANGNVDAFKKFGITIEEGKNKSETFANTLKTLNERFGGSAQQQVKTFGGGIELLKNSYGDLTKEIGFVFTKNNSVIGIMGALNNLMLDGTKGIEGQNQALKLFVSEGLSGILGGLAALSSFVDVTIRSMQVLLAVVSSLALVVQAVWLPLEVLFTGSTDAAKRFQKDMEQTGRNFSAFGASGDGAFAAVTQSLLTMREASLKGFSDMKAGIDSTIEPTNNLKQAGIELSEAEKKAAEQRAELAQQGKDLANELLAKGTEDSLARLQVIADEEMEKLALLNTARETNSISQQVYEASMKALKDKSAAEDKARKDKQIADEKSKDLEKMKFEHTVLRSKVDMASAASNLITATSKSDSKAAFLVAKAAAIAQSIVSTHVAAAQALAFPPGPPATIPLAASIKAAGYMNTAAIAATAIQGLRSGIDEVPGIGFRDSFPAMLAPRERVVPRETNQDLKAFLARESGGAGGGGRVDVHLHFDGANAIPWIEARLVERIRLGTSDLGQALAG